MITRSEIIHVVDEAPLWFWTDDIETDLGTLADLLDVEKWQLVHSPLRDFALETIVLTKEVKQ